MGEITTCTNFFKKGELIPRIICKRVRINNKFDESKENFQEGIVKGKFSARKKCSRESFISRRRI